MPLPPSLDAFREVWTADPGFSAGHLDDPDAYQIGKALGGMLVASVTEVPFGAHPSSCYPGYAYDRPHLAAYVAAATAGGAPLADYLQTYVLGVADEEVYRTVIGEERLAALGRWSDSTEAWKELFA